MVRFSINSLLEWKNSKNRKPLILRGARQVGKTWLMLELGQKYYSNYVYFNFDSDKNNILKNIFEKGFDVDDIIKSLEILSQQKIKKDNTLIIFDEIQEVPKALASLKYFNENATDYHIICAGSLLGVALHEGISFPVGKVDFIDIYPLNFSEFLMAIGKEDFANLILSHDFYKMDIFHDELVKYLKEYYVVGGMPEVVVNYITDKDFNTVRKTQENILRAYEFDFSKHAKNEIVPRLRLLWNSIPKQLSKENKKFIYGLIKDGARAREFEVALMWLIDYGLLYKVSRVSKPAIPLTSYIDDGAFKLFILDVGLLGALSGLDVVTLIDGNKIFTEFKGALTEQFVLQQLISNSVSAYYWSAERATAEVDFIFYQNNEIVPLEVKAEINLKSKSLKSYIDKFNPKVAVRTSMAKYKVDNKVMNIPLYAINIIRRLVDNHLAMP